MSRSRAERRRAAREAREPIEVAVVSEASPELSEPDDALRGAIFAAAFLVGPDAAASAAYEWEFEQGETALERLRSLVRANPPARLRQHYRRLRADLRSHPAGYIGFARATLTE